MSVSGNDGLHSDVLSKVTLEFITFTNSTIENTATIQISGMTSGEFLSKHYRPFLDSLQEDLNAGEVLLIYSIDETDEDLKIFVAIESPQGFRTKQEVVDYLQRKKRQLQDLVEDGLINIGYSSCRADSCQNGGVCHDEIVVGDEARIVDSQSLILTSPKISHQITCICPDGFTGDLCEKKLDPCSPNPCHLVR